MFHLLAKGLSHFYILRFKLQAWHAGYQLLRAARQIERDRRQTEGSRLSEAYKIGIHGYYIRYAEHFFDRLEALETVPDKAGDLLDNISVSPEEVQKFSPDLTFHQALRIQYQTRQNDLSALPIDQVIAGVSSMHCVAQMGLTYHYFKQEIGRSKCLFWHPSYMPEIGPTIAFVKIARHPQVRHYSLRRPQNVRDQ